MSQCIQKLKNFYRKERTYLSWIKNFGVENAFFMKQIDQKRQKDIYGMWNPNADVLERTKKEYEKNEVDIHIVTALNNENCAKKWNSEIREKDAQFYLCVTEDVELSRLSLWALSQKIVQSKNDASILYSDQCLGEDYIYKPDFAIDTLLAQNYIGKMLCVSKKMWQKLGGFNEDYPEVTIFDFILRTYESFGANNILHVEKAIFREKRMEKQLSIQEQEMLMSHQFLERKGIDASVRKIGEGLYHVDYVIIGKPKVSIVIPNKDNVPILRQCIDSILKKSSYGNYEILVVENNSVERETFEYYDELQKSEGQRVKVVKCVTDWNYSYINNYGVKFTSGEYIILLNNDTEVISEDWIEQMLQYAQQQEIGIVGAKLLYPDGTIQHGGVTLGIRGVAGHAFHGWDGTSEGYMNRLITVQDLSAVTAACLMIPRKVFDEVGGLDEKFRVAFNDTDLCMRVRKAGYSVIYNPMAELVHHESKSRGTDEQSPEKLKRFNGESMRFQRIYCKEITMGDPYYNFNLQRVNDDFMVAKWE